jgi:hypothetical protein
MLRVQLAPWATNEGLAAKAILLTLSHHQGKGNMVERRSELNRRYHRKQKLRKLKSRLARAKDGRDKENILRKIHVLSPFWKESATA